MRLQRGDVVKVVLSAGNLAKFSLNGGAETNVTWNKRLGAVRAAAAFRQTGWQVTFVP